ncbi:MAG: CBS domain-containing protein [Desulfosudis oleivorans]|nr:CBS domain-containing protein [Desulfosudis oleivorans]
MTREALVGIITDGDLRRALERTADILATKAKEVMTPSPKTILKTELAATAVRIMEKHSITSLFVLHTPASQKVAGIIHLHDILRAGSSDAVCKTRRHSTATPVQGYGMSILEKARHINC